MNQASGDFPPLSLEQRARLAERYGLSEAELGTLLADLWLLSEEGVEDYARRRHGELRAAGLPNERCFELLEREIASGRFAAPPLSQRQIKRMIYG
ncbi:MAG TPA: hypothetical protein PLB91_09910 [Spirochaetales bacterium]|nr:hypothetical protein [Spirochaetales bacterium]HRY56186.1 hypothetical protein [Spirochaetia bacterium]HRZ66200.1 hypothetical protein [Spirochaetia bacterium]